MTDDPDVVGGRYELGDLLGRGGMAEVRRAVDRRLGRGVAVKQLRADLATDPTFQARFRREAQSAAGLNHPTIVAVYDTGEETDARTGISIPYIVMELVEGPTLRDVLRDGRKILPERALELTQGVLDALSYSHKAGIIHRDIKPANVMLTPTGRGQGDGLRHRPRGGRHQRHHDPDRRGHRHRPVPLTGAGAWRDRGRPQRHLLRRLPALRAARRPTPVHRRVPGQRGLPARTRSSDPAQPARSGDQRRHRRRDPQGPGQGRGRPLSVGSRDEGRHLPGAGRPAGDRGGPAGGRRAGGPGLRHPDPGGRPARGHDAVAAAARPRGRRGAGAPPRRAGRLDHRPGPGRPDRWGLRDLSGARAGRPRGGSGRGAQRLDLHRAAGQRPAHRPWAAAGGQARERR